MVIKTTVLGCLSNLPLRPVCLSWSHEEGGRSGSGWEQVDDGGTGGDRAARWDSDMIGSDVMGRSSLSCGGKCEGSTGSTTCSCIRTINNMLRKNNKIAKESLDLVIMSHLGSAHHRTKVH